MKGAVKPLNVWYHVVSKLFLSASHFVLYDSLCKNWWLGLIYSTFPIELLELAHFIITMLLHSYHLNPLTIPDLVTQ